MDRLAADKSDVDESLPPGTIVVEVRDKADQPLPRTDVTLGILQQSVAKGESRKRTNRQADESGTVRFDGLEARRPRSRLLRFSSICTMASG